MKTKRLTKILYSAVLSASIILSPLGSLASTLGSTKIDGYSVKIGQGLNFTHNLFFSDQSGVGKQSENYITYTPNDIVFPTITYGDTLYGGNTLSNQISLLEKEGKDVLAGTNADYFSLHTLVPMSNAIVDGKILTKDASGQDGIGFLPDGTAFISYFYLNSVLQKEDGSELNIYNINKYRQPYSAYMMTSDFSSETQNTTEGIDVILNPIDGEMKLGTKLTAVVETISENSSSIPIPEGKIVLTVDKKAPEEFLSPIFSLTEGEIVTINFSVSGDKRWNDVVCGMGSVGGRLLIDGEVNPNLATGAAPRTAIGITKDGEIILYTIDGRQSGHSYGVQLRTLAKRMKELGCIEALNLDGGGSTAISAQLPGNETASLMNKPSDGKERKLSTHIVFTNTAEKTGKFENLHIYPLTNYVLTGASTKLTVKATDSGFYPVDVPKNVNFSIQDGKNSTVTNDGVFTAKDSGAVTVYAESGDVSASTSIVCLATPTDIKIKDKNSGKYITSLNLDPGDTVSLTAEAYGGYNRLVAKDENFTWEADENIGSISKDFVFTASGSYGESGNINISAGDKTVSIPVTLTPADANDPKSYPIIVDTAYTLGTFTGKISCEYDIPTTADGILVRADGKETGFSYNAETGEFAAQIPVGVKKVTIIASNIFGYTTFKTFDIFKASYPSGAFSDTAGHWADDILRYMKSQKIINGEMVGDELRFNPQKAMTRSEFAVIVTNFLGVDKTKYQDVVLPYSDLDTIPFWALDSFKVLYNLGILKGRYVSDTESCADPLSSISRAEAATIVARTLPSGFFKGEITATDKDDIPAWAMDGIRTLVNIGAMKGYEDQSFKPLNPLTKAEAAKILYSAM
ncbi:MAG: phosphodiester glycosidase family protein [Clostridia bacterium]|nr:phosphodiester glycosidase family protein [Clostridia bacterium]